MHNIPGSLLSRQKFLPWSPMVFKLEKYFRRIRNKNRRSRLTNLRHAYQKWPAESFPWHAALLLSQNFLHLLSDQSLCIVNDMYMYVYIYIYAQTHTHTHTHTHTSHCVETVFELVLLPNSTASETFLHKSGAVRSFDWIFIIVVPAWQWLNEYMTMDKNVLQSSLQTGSIISPSYLDIFFLMLFLKEAFIRYRVQ